MINNFQFMLYKCWVFFLLVSSELLAYFYSSHCKWNCFLNFCPTWMVSVRNMADFPVSCESWNYADFYYLLRFSGCLGYSAYITKSLKTGLCTSFFTVLVFVICPCWITLPRPSTTVLHGCGQYSVLGFVLILECS